MRTLALAALLALVAPTALHGQDRIEVPHELYVLDNGLSVILAPDHTLPRVEVNLWYHVGSKNEVAGRSGFAHLFEHLMFMGTERVPTGAFDGIMEGGGGANNASTSEDRTNYFDWGPPALLQTLLWLEADRLENLGRTMTQEKLDLQREVVRNERRQTSENTPYGKADLLVSELMYPPGHPYHISVIGRHEDLVAASVPDVQDFFARWYVPNNASLCIVGDFDPAAARAWVAQYFGDLPPGPEPPATHVDPVMLDGPRGITLQDAVQYPRLSFTWHSPATLAPGDAEMDLAADALAGGRNSRLYQRLVVKDGTAVDVAAYQQSQLLGSLFTVVVTTAPGADLAAVTAAVDDEIGRLREEGPTAEELQRSVAGIETGAVSELESLHARADSLNRYLFFYGTPDGFERDLDRYRHATPASVRGWARQVLDPARRLTMSVLPDGSLPATTARDTQPALDTTPTRFTPPVPVALPTRPSGLEVWHLQRPGLPLVNVTLVLPGGRLAETRAQAGLSELTASMLEEGAGSRDSAAFADALQQLGAEFSVNSQARQTTVAVEVLKRNLDGALALFHDAVTVPRLDAADFERVRRLSVDDLRAALDDPNTVARQVAAATWFGEDHPYGRPSGGFPETVAALELDQVRAFHASLAQPAGALLIVTGDVSADEASAIADTLDRDWPAAGTPLVAAATPVPPAAGVRVVLVDRPDASQTVVRFVMPGQRGTDARRVPSDVFNTLFGGSFTSRLNRNLREEHGYTYGAGSSFARQPDQGVFIANAAVRTNVTGDSLAEFIAEFKRARAGGIAPEEAAGASASALARLVSGFESLGSTVGTWLVVRDRGGSPQELARDVAALPGVTAAQLDALAPELLQTDQLLLVLVGDGKTVLPQLSELGLPPVRILDERGHPVTGQAPAAPVAPATPAGSGS